MKKLFLLLFVSIFVISTDVSAGITEMNNIEQIRTKKTAVKKVSQSKMPKFKKAEDIAKFLGERMKVAEYSDLEEGEDLTSTSAMNIQHSQEYLEQLKEQEKSTFEKLYDAAVSRLTNREKAGKDIVASSNTVFYREVLDNDIQEMAEPDFPTVEVKLPSERVVLAPAMEHIPYLMTNIELLPTGLIKINETVIVVANGKKLNNGLTKMLPRFSVSRSGVKHKIDYDDLKVTINGSPMPHKFVESGNSIIIKPQEKYVLGPGVYTYRFSYMLDRHLWEYKDFDELYWDVAGSRWNLLISKAGAVVTYPGVKAPISQNVLIGYEGKTAPNRARVIKYENNSMGFFSTTPILIGEGMHILISLPKESMISPDFNKRFSWFVEDYGDNLFALLGFVAILISYIISWSYIRREKTSASKSLKKLPTILRFMLYGKFDKISFGGFILDLYRRNILDVEEKEEKISLIKKTDNLKGLSGKERAVVNAMFANGDSVLVVDNKNALKFKRAYNVCEKDTKKKIRFMNLQMNISYLLFSVAMLLISEVAISLNNVNFVQTMLMLLSADITIAFYVWILLVGFKHKWMKILAGTFAVIIILFTFMIMSIYISGIAAAFIIGMIVTMFMYSRVFAKRNGLMRAKIKEALKYRNYLENNVSVISLGRDFMVHQANIFALELPDLYDKELKDKEYCKLKEVTKIIKLL